MTKAGLQWPVLGLAEDGQAWGLGKGDMGTSALAPKLVADDRHIGMELVDSAERRWTVVGRHRTEPPRWRRFVPVLKDKTPREQFLLEPAEPIAFEAVRKRVLAYAQRLFPDTPEMLADLRGAVDVAELAEQCGIINARQVARDIVNGASAATRAASEVALRAVLTFAAVCVAIGKPRGDALAWVRMQKLYKDLSPSEELLFAVLTPSEQQLIEMGWRAESVAVFLWALNLLELPPAGEKCDVGQLAELVPPTSETGLNDFIASAGIRPARELASYAETAWKHLADAERKVSEDDEVVEVAIVDFNIAYNRCLAIQWVIEPNGSWL